MRTQLTYMAMGAALASLGFLAGEIGDYAAPARAQFQNDRGRRDAPYFRSGREAIITTSADGLTLYFWSPQGTNEDLLNRTLPVYQGSVSAR